MIEGDTSKVDVSNGTKNGDESTNLPDSVEKVVIQSLNEEKQVNIDTNDVEMSGIQSPNNDKKIEEHQYIERINEMVNITFIRFWNKLFVFF